MEDQQAKSGQPEGSSGGECKSHKLPSIINYDEVSIKNMKHSNSIKQFSSSSHTDNLEINRDSMVFRSRDNKYSIDGGSSILTNNGYPSIEHKSDDHHKSNNKKRAVPMS